MSGSPLSAPREVRFRWYRQVEKYGKTINEVCDIFGISPKTYHKWYRRDHGYGSNQYRPKRAHPHTKLTPRVRAFIVDEKTKYNYGPKKMALRVKDELEITISPTIIYRLYQRKGLIRKPQRKQEWYTPMLEPYQAQKPGQNVQLDVKYVPGPDLTWRYQYRFVDTVTNLQYATEWTTRDGQASIRALAKAQAHFPFVITGIQTDNGGEFRGDFHTHLIVQGITHRYIPKRSAPWNGKVERANRSVDDEFYLNSTKPWKTLVEYTRWYNHERPHLGKGMNGLTPYQKYLSLTRKTVTLEC